MSQSTISSLYSGSFGSNQTDVNIQQPTIPDAPDTETVMAYNEDLDITPPQDISNVFAAADLSSDSSYNSNKYKRAWRQVKVIHSYILSYCECPDTCSRALSIAPIKNKFNPIWT